MADRRHTAASLGKIDLDINLVYFPCGIKRETKRDISETITSTLVQRENF